MKLRESENYYETNTVGATRKEFVCDYCGKTIPKGSSCSKVKFADGDYWEVAVHGKCLDKYLDQIVYADCGEYADSEDSFKDNDNKDYCYDCANEKGLTLAAKFKALDGE